MSGNRNSGRKSSSDEELLISKLDNIIDSDEAILRLKELINEGSFRALQLYMHYRFGSPKKQIEISSQNEEQPLFMPTIKFTHRE